MDALALHPEFVSRFPPKIHVNGDELVANVQAYFLERWPFASEKKKQDYLAMEVEPWALEIIYGAPMDRAELYVAWSTFYWLYDDMLEDLSAAEAQKSGARMIEIMSRRMEPEDGMESVLHDLSCRIRQTSISSNIKGLGEVAERFIKTGCDYVVAAVAKAQRVKSLRDGLEAYLKHRFYDVGAGFVLEGQLWARGIVLTPDMLSDPDAAVLQDITLEHFIFTNDMFSYRKEKKHFERMKLVGVSKDRDDSGNGFIIYNSLAIFLEYYHMSPSDAMEEIKRRIRGDEEQFLEVLEKVRGKYAQSVEDREIIERASTAMMDLMGGNADWSRWCVRYNAGV
ncbi:hypothetical protein D9756_009965 [Leucocoprinus leucothites]|uniref:Terpene synthase n=1 Tax=Leucocoprinus leucothites TaxID=201217 RepID=A0A8H5CSZ4_9AGAR|nr:hypothetical protein D9756_009965 [Leucoagaricus leucothites]